MCPFPAPHPSHSSLPAHSLAAMPLSERALHTLPPHIFGFVKDAMTTLQADGVPQCITVTGESGSGKTATLKIALQYLIDASKAARASVGGGKTKSGMSAGPCCTHREGRLWWWWCALGVLHVCRHCMCCWVNLLVSAGLS